MVSNRLRPCQVRHNTKMLHTTYAEKINIEVLALILFFLHEGKNDIHSQKSVIMDVKIQFENAVADSKTLPAKPSNETLLNLYSLYKQATEGDVNGEPPTTFDFVAKAKYEAWASLKGKTKESAMEEYVKLVEK